MLSPYILLFFFCIFIRKLSWSKTNNNQEQPRAVECLNVIYIWNANCPLAELVHISHTSLLLSNFCSSSCQELTQFSILLLTALLRFMADLASTAAPGPCTRSPLPGCHHRTPNHPWFWRLIGRSESGVNKHWCNSSLFGHLHLNSILKLFRFSLHNRIIL